MFQCLNKGIIKQKHCLVIHLFKMCSVLRTHLNVTHHFQRDVMLVDKAGRYNVILRGGPPNWLLLFFPLPVFGFFFPFKGYLLNQIQCDFSLNI